MRRRAGRHRGDRARRGADLGRDRVAPGALLQHVAGVLDERAGPVRDREGRGRVRGRDPEDPTQTPGCGVTPMRVANKTALVTGAAQGFGLGIAETFAREGARVAIVDLNADAAATAAARIGAGALALGCDVSRREEVDRAIAETIRTFGRIDIVVNNAGT